MCPGNVNAPEQHHPSFPMYHVLNTCRLSAQDSCGTCASEACALHPWLSTNVANVTTMSTMSGWSRKVANLFSHDLK